MEERPDALASSTMTVAGMAVMIAPTREAGGWRRLPPGVTKGMLLMEPVALG